MWQWLCEVWAGAPVRPPDPQELHCKAEEARRATAASAVHSLDLSTRAKLSSSVAQVPQVILVTAALVTTTLP